MNTMATPDLANALSAAHRLEISEVLHRPATSGPLRTAIGVRLVRTGLRVLRIPVDQLPPPRQVST